MGDPKLAPVPDDQVRREESRIAEYLKKDGPENPYDIRRELRTTMQKHVGVYRDGEELAEGMRKVRELRERFQNIHVKDRSRVYNSNLFHVLEIENLLDLAEVMILGAHAREESRGGHARRDFTTRDDEKFLKHTLVWKKGGELELDYKPVAITKWKPVERKY